MEEVAQPKIITETNEKNKVLPVQVDLGMLHMPSKRLVHGIPNAIGFTFFGQSVYIMSAEP